MVSVRSNIPKHANIEDSDIQQWLQSIAEYYPPNELDKIYYACQFAKDNYQDNCHPNTGETYLKHAIAVADIVVHLGMDTETVIATLLHEIYQVPNHQASVILAKFGANILHMIDGINKMQQIDQYQEQTNQHLKKEQHIESLRKLLLAIVEDVKVVLIRLADCLYDMRHLSVLSEDKQKIIAKTTQEIYAPLANRLGIWQIKWELEDLSFRYLQPKIYKNLAKLLDERRIDREIYIHKVIEILEKELKKAGIKAEITGRPKHIYSIWKKMQRKGVDFDQIFDVRAVRIMVETKTDCYTVLGLVHNLWKPLHGEFDDYIASPKENRYQSLHTAVMTSNQNKPLEIQIRTFDMHHQCELGIAAHWRYKEGEKKADKQFEKKIVWMRQLLEESHDNDDFLEQFKSEVYEDRVYVLTPKGDVIDLPKGSTPLDFSYYIHTDIGHRCRGAKINGKIVTLNSVLNNGDIVEILTHKEPNPSQEWLNPHLNYIKTHKARSKIKAWFRVQNYENNVTTGKNLLEKELNRLGINNLSHELLAKHFKYPKLTEFLAAVGYGEISHIQIVSAVEYITTQKSTQTNTDTDNIATLSTNQHFSPQTKNHSVKILGVENLLTHIANCCKPVPYDPIIGYITHGRGVSIHKQDCTSLKQMQTETEPDRFIEVEWNNENQARYQVDIQILAYDRRDLLRDISSLLSTEKINVLAVHTQTHKNKQIADMKLTIEIENILQLSRIINRISQLSNILDVYRN